LNGNLEVTPMRHGTSPRGWLRKDGALETIMKAAAGDRKPECASPRPLSSLARAWEELARLALQPVGGRRLSAHERLERMALLPGHDATGHDRNIRMLSLQAADSVPPSENPSEMSL
jgi:hypothetical protein